MFYLAVIFWIILLAYLKSKNIYGKYIKSNLLKKIQKPYSFVCVSLNKFLERKSETKRNIFVFAIFLFLIFVGAKTSFFLDEFWGKQLCGYDEDGEWSCLGNINFAIALMVSLHFFFYNKFSLGNKSYDKIINILENLKTTIPENLKNSYNNIFSDYIEKLPNEIVINDEWRDEEQFVFLTILPSIERYFCGDHHLYRGVLIDSKMKQLHNYFLQECLERNYINDEEFSNIKKHREELIKYNG